MITLQGPIAPAGLRLKLSLNMYSADIQFLQYMLGQPGHNTRPQPRLPHSFLGMDAWMNSKLTVVLIRALRGSLVFLAYFLTCYPWVFVQPGTGGRPVNWCRN